MKKLIPKIGLPNIEIDKDSMSKQTRNEILDEEKQMDGFIGEVNDELLRMNREKLKQKIMVDNLSESNKEVKKSQLPSLPPIFNADLEEEKMEEEIEIPVYKPEMKKEVEIQERQSVTEIPNIEVVKQEVKENNSSNSINTMSKEEIVPDKDNGDNVSVAGKKLSKKQIEKLRKTKRWKTYFNTLRPRDSKGGVKPFPKYTSSKGMNEEDYKKYIDKMVLIEVDEKNLGGSFDKFYKASKN